MSVESYWPSLFAKLAEKRSIDDLVMNVGAGGGGGAVAVSAQPAGGAAAEAKAPVEEKKVYCLYALICFRLLIHVSANMIDFSKKICSALFGNY